jgi:hypothetical protein
VNERAVLFGKTKNLVGVLTQTSSNGSRDNYPAVILLNAGLMHHVGPNRINVQLARRLAASGFPTLRFDLSGIGDSGNRTDNLSLGDGVVNDVKQAMDFLASEQGVRQFILTGICSGANNSLRVAQSDARVIGVAPIEVYYFENRGYHFYFYRKRLLQLAGWRRLITMKSGFWGKMKKYMMRRNEVSPTVNAWSGQIAAERGGDFKSRIVSEIQHLLGRGVNLHFLYCVDSPSYYNHYLPLRHKFGSWKQIRVTRFPNTDHIFTLLSSQQCLVDSIHEWVQEVAQASNHVTCDRAR